MKKARIQRSRLAIGGVLLFGIVWFADPREVFAVLAGANWIWLTAGLILSVLSNVISALRWRELAAWLGHPITSTTALQIYFRAMALNALLPGGVVGGDVYRALVLRQQGMHPMGATLSVLLDRVWGFWLVIAISIMGSAFTWTLIAGQVSWTDQFPEPSKPLFVVIGILWTLLPLLFLRRLAPAWRRFHEEVISLETCHMRIRRQYVLQSVAALCVQWLSIGALALGAKAIHLELSTAVWATVSFPIFLMAAIPVSWGGWGAREAAAAGALSVFGVSAAQGVGAGLIYGIYALVQAAAGAALFGWHSMQQQTELARKLNQHRHTRD